MQSTPDFGLMKRNGRCNSFFCHYFIVSFLLCLSAPPVLAHVPTDTVSFTDWNWRPDVLVFVIFFGAVYIRGWLRLRRRSAPVVERWPILVYLLGLTSVALALL